MNLSEMMFKKKRKKRKTYLWPHFRDPHYHPCTLFVIMSSGSGKLDANDSQSRDDPSLLLTTTWALFHNTVIFKKPSLTGCDEWQAFSGVACGWAIPPAAVRRNKRTYHYYCCVVRWNVSVITAALKEICNVIHPVVGIKSMCCIKRFWNIFFAISNVFGP